MTSVTPRRSRGLAAAFAVAAAFVTASVAGAVAPAVTNITAAQRPGQSRLVDITYNLTDPDSARLLVEVKISNDGGATWSIIPTALTGDVGQNVAPGTGKHIVWDAGADIRGAYGTQYKAMVIATESDYTGEMICETLYLPVIWPRSQADIQVVE